jgi:hypothetical protein
MKGRTTERQGVSEGLIDSVDSSMRPPVLYLVATPCGIRVSSKKKARQARPQLALGGRLVTSIPRMHSAQTCARVRHAVIILFRRVSQPVRCPSRPCNGYGNKGHPY